ncbi:RNA polymerase subunit sigma-70 [Clostridium botulinum]|uniref:RNA polymerase sigma-70 factor n=1 Tax=Clostridium botulinum C/D str. DC5 TaxID=1443128 RepID=A0A0A0IJT2_CLOBO|nr:sigma-70 family RNA polymerase sigma factor [Clostridium botulinum]KGN00547.1 RNA polymerase sigma-70 factor [Clostridium botulinum C/D str. DC5]KOC51927.1 RNA polymerase subunit sigma-70 [Clostridium botulinum]KOC55085.1 RNA polymerase subunit sigma-70 [Clostridium botulinum]MCD3235006.1 sigma-70 family RNA polymerase sigma factor [Clostridium botulinum D/C]MCD3240884.1 sigma-70 family RNA polymerase sigma factor [Clostridium botulinum D/C]
MNNETKLIKQIKTKGNRKAANELITRYYKEIYAYVYKQTMDKEMSMDLTQEIFINMLKSINTYDDKKASFRTWLYKISTYKIIDYYRSKHYKYKKISINIEDTEIHDNGDVFISVEYKEDIQKIINTVDKFDELLQQIFRLKIFAEYTFLEISKTLEIPESTVKTKYYSLIKKIKKICEE